jgi:hypothetical protein
MPGFNSPEFVRAAPVTPSGVAYTFERRVKVFEAATPAALETAINAFLTTLPATVIKPMVVGYINLTGSAAGFRCLMDYGYFTIP